MSIIKVLVKRKVNTENYKEYNMYIYIDKVKTFSDKIINSYNNKYSDKNGMFYFPFLTNEMFDNIDNDSTNKIYSSEYIVRYGVSDKKLLIFFDNLRCFDIDLQDELIKRYDKIIKKDFFNVISYYNGDELYMKYYIKY